MSRDELESVAQRIANAIPDERDGQDVMEFTGEWPEWKTVDLLPLFWCWTVAVGDAIERNAFFDQVYASSLPRMSRIVETGVGYMIQEVVSQPAPQIVPAWRVK